MSRMESRVPLPASLVAPVRFLGDAHHPDQEDRRRARRRLARRYRAGGAGPGGRGACHVRLPAAGPASRVPQREGARGAREAAVCRGHPATDARGADSRELEGGARAGGAEADRGPPHPQTQVGPPGPRHLRVPRGGEARAHARAHRQVPPEAHGAQGHRRPRAGPAQRAAGAEGAVDAGRGRQAQAQRPGAGDDRDPRRRCGQRSPTLSAGAGRGARDPGGRRADHGHAARRDGRRHRAVPERLSRGGQAGAATRHPHHPPRGEAAAAARAGRRVRARGGGLRVARGAPQGRAGGPRKGGRARGGRPGAPRLDRADRAGQPRRGAATAGRARAGRVRPGLRHPGGPLARLRAGIPARGRGAGAAGPDPGLGRGAPWAARDPGGARAETPGEIGRARDARRGSARDAREGQAAARSGARPYRREGVYVSSVAIHRGASVTRNQIYPPYIIERSSRGERTYDIFSRLLMDRIVFLGTQINDEVSNIIIAQLLFLDADNPERDIYLYVNSPGGLVSSGMAIYDTMQFLRAPVNTICMGMAASMGSFLLAAGRKGKRSALPHARIMMHQPSGGTQGTAADIEIQAREILFLRRKLNELYAKHTGKTVDSIEKDMDRDRFMSAEEAKEYGLIDHVISNFEEIKEDGKAKK